MWRGDGHREPPGRDLLHAHTVTLLITFLESSKQACRHFGFTETFTASAEASRNLSVGISHELS